MATATTDCRACHERWPPRRSTSGRSPRRSPSSRAARCLFASAFTWRQGALFLVGAGAGVVLYHAAFGFTSLARHDREGRGAGLRAQMLMLAATCAVFLPMLAVARSSDTRFAAPCRRSACPVIVGAFLFGVGMQLGGGCASGTLYTAGGGSVRMFGDCLRHSSRDR